MNDERVKRASAGNSGDDVRSDCFVTIELTGSGGLQIQLSSKVMALYGASIKQLAHDILEYFGIGNAVVEIDDSGALPFVIAARMEAAIKKLTSSTKEFLPLLLNENKDTTAKDRSRFTRLYLPGNTPKLMINAGIHGPDGIILDLEDSVAFDKKHEARFLVRNALRSVNFYGAERMVRINQLPVGLDDLEYVVPHHVNLVLIPKCEHPDQVRLVHERIQQIQHRVGQSGDIWLMPIIESAKGVVNCYEIAETTDTIAAMAIGLEDLTADIGTARTELGEESLFARSKLVIACKAAGIQAIDSVFSDVADMEGLTTTIQRSKALGFNGMGCIHPRQIEVIRQNYAPQDDEIENAKQVYQAFMEAEEKGLGAVSLGTKMIDPPVVQRAIKILDLAIESGKISKDWREKND